MIVFPFWLLTAFLALMLKWTLNLSAFVLALPMLYIFGCGLYTLYCREWMQFLILLVAEFGCFVLIDKSRIQRFLGQTTRREMRRIEEALLNSLEINEWDRRNADE